MLDTGKIKKALNWAPVWHVDEAVRETVKWYRAWHDKEDMLKYTEEQIALFLEK
jgi:CDP-glucose 4,6-dehydratase